MFNKIDIGKTFFIYTRHHDWSGVRQSVVLEGGQWYAAKAYIRLLNMPPGVAYVTVDLMASLIVNGLKFTKMLWFCSISLKVYFLTEFIYYAGHVKNETVGKILMQQEKFGWTEVGGDFLTTNG